jgi:hypothetical protein
MPTVPVSRATSSADLVTIADVFRAHAPPAGALLLTRAMSAARGFEPCALDDATAFPLQYDLP